MSANERLGLQIEVSSTNADAVFTNLLTSIQKISEALKGIGADNLTKVMEGIGKSATGLQQGERALTSFKGAIADTAKDAASLGESFGKGADSWRQFVSQNMSEYKKLGGTHQEVMAKMGADWNAYKQKGKEAADAVEQSIIQMYNKLSKTRAQGIDMNNTMTVQRSAYTPSPFNPNSDANAHLATRNRIILENEEKLGQQIIAVNKNTDATRRAQAIAAAQERILALKQIQANELNDTRTVQRSTYTPSPLNPNANADSQVQARNKFILEGEVNLGQQILQISRNTESARRMQEVAAVRDRNAALKQLQAERLNDELTASKAAKEAWNQNSWGRGIDRVNQEKMADTYVSSLGKQGIDASGLAKKTYVVDPVQAESLARTEQLSRVLDTIVQKSRTTKLSTDEISESFRKAGINFADLNRVDYSKVNTSLGSIGKQLNGIQVEAKETGLLMNVFGNSIGGMLARLTEFYSIRGILFGVSSEIRSAINGLIEFKQTVAEIAAITTASKTQISEFEATISQLARSSKYTAQEIAATMKVVAQSGISAEDLTKVTRASEMLAAAVGDNPVAAANLTTTVLKVWNIDADNAVKVTNTMAAALKNSKLTVNELSTSFNYLATQAKASNMSLEETTGAVATMRNMGVQASSVGTGLSQFLRVLNAPTPKIKNLWKEMGLSSEDLDIKKKELSEIIRTITEKGIATYGTPGNLNNKISAAFEARTGRAAIAALTAGADSFSAMTETMKFSDAGMLALDRTMEGTQTKINKLRHELMLAVQNFSNDFSPAIKTAYETLMTFTKATQSDMFRAFVGVEAKVIIPTLAVSAAIYKVYEAYKTVTLAGPAVEGSLRGIAGAMSFFLNMNPVIRALGLAFGALSIAYMATADAFKPLNTEFEKYFKSSKEEAEHNQIAVHTMNQYLTSIAHVNNGKAQYNDLSEKQKLKLDQLESKYPGIISLIKQEGSVQGALAKKIGEVNTERARSIYLDAMMYNKALEQKKAADEAYKKASDNANNSWSNAIYDRAEDQARKEKDPKKRSDLLKQVQEERDANHTMDRALDGLQAIFKGSAGALDQIVGGIARKFGGEWQPMTDVGGRVAAKSSKEVADANFKALEFSAGASSFSRDKDGFAVDPLTKKRITDMNGVDAWTTFAKKNKIVNEGDESPDWDTDKPSVSKEASMKSRTLEQQIQSVKKRNDFLIEQAKNDLLTTEELIDIKARVEYNWNVISALEKEKAKEDGTKSSVDSKGNVILDPSKQIAETNNKINQETQTNIKKYSDQIDHIINERKKLLEKYRFEVTQEEDKTEAAIAQNEGTILDKIIKSRTATWEDKYKAYTEELIDNAKKNKATRDKDLAKLDETFQNDMRDKRIPEGSPQWNQAADDTESIKDSVRKHSESDLAKTNTASYTKLATSPLAINIYEVERSANIALKARTDANALEEKRAWTAQEIGEIEASTLNAQISAQKMKDDAYQKEIEEINKRKETLKNAAISEEEKALLAKQYNDQLADSDVKLTEGLNLINQLIEKQRDIARDSFGDNFLKGVRSSTQKFIDVSGTTQQFGSQVTDTVTGGITTGLTNAMNVYTNPDKAIQANDLNISILKNQQEKAQLEQQIQSLSMNSNKTPQEINDLNNKKIKLAEINNTLSQQELHLKQLTNGWQAFLASLKNIMNDIMTELEKYVAKLLAVWAIEQVVGLLAGNSSADSTGVLMSDAGAPAFNTSDTFSTSPTFQPDTSSFSMVSGHANGGFIPLSAGQAGVDSVPAMLTPGEVIIKKSSVDYYGADKLLALNDQKIAKFASGGLVGGSSSSGGSSDKQSYQLTIVNVADPTSVPRMTGDEVINIVSFDAAKKGSVYKTIKGVMQNG